MIRIDKYVTPMFPYPSGAGLHMGHYYNYAIVDSYCNYLRFIGKQVFQPIGYDAFGLPAENYARKVGREAADVTNENIENFRKQFDKMNTNYEELLVTTSEPYQKVAQNIFNLLLNAGLAYKKFGDVDYCDSCETTLAKEQVVDGKCERCKSIATTKQLDQWYIKTTDYTDRLLAGLDDLDWPESTKTQQRNWMSDGKHRDWCVSRQRKWGCPIPVEGETDTLDTFFDSSFYTIAYCMVKGIIPRPVDLYVGGSEHACMHLIYARFMAMFLYDQDVIDFEEPFTKLIHQGMILTKDDKGNTVKMSKSSGHVVSPDDYDPDVLRFYLMFLGHYFDGGVFDDQNISGVKKFFSRWKLLMERDGEDTADVETFQNTIFSFTESFKFNKVVSSFMTFYNQNKGKSFNQETKVVLNKLLLIYAPSLDLQTEIKTIPFNIWDDYLDDGFADDKKQETRMYLESDDFDDDEVDNIMEILIKAIKLFGYDKSNCAFDNDVIHFKDLPHKKRYELLEALEKMNLSYKGLSFSIYSES